MRLFRPLALLFYSATAVYADDKELKLTAPDTSEAHNVSIPITFEWTMPEAYSNLNRLNISLYASVEVDGQHRRYVQAVASDIDASKLRYEWNPRNFTDWLDEDSATLWTGKENSVLAHFASTTPHTGFDFAEVWLEDLELEGYHRMAPGESGANVLNRSSWAVGAGALIVAMAAGICVP